MSEIKKEKVAEGVVTRTPKTQQTTPEEVTPTQDKVQSRTKSNLEARKLDRQSRRNKRSFYKELAQDITVNPDRYSPYMQEGEGYRDFLRRVENLVDNDIIINRGEADSYFSQPDLNKRYKIQGSISYDGSNYDIDQILNNNWEQGFRSTHTNWANENLSGREKDQYLIDVEKQIKAIKNGSFNFDSNSLAGQNTAWLFMDLNKRNSQKVQQQKQEEEAAAAAKKTADDEAKAKLIENFKYAAGKESLYNEAKKLLGQILGQENGLVFDASKDIESQIEDLLYKNENIRELENEIRTIYGLQPAMQASDDGSDDDSDDGGDDGNKPWTFNIAEYPFTFEYAIKDVKDTDTAKNFIDDLLREFKKQLGNSIQGADGSFNNYRMYSYNQGDKGTIYILKDNDSYLTQGDFDGEQKVMWKDPKNSNIYSGTLKNGELILDNGTKINGLTFNDVSKVSAVGFSGDINEIFDIPTQPANGNTVVAEQPEVQQTSVDTKNYTKVLQSRTKINGIDWYDVFNAIDPRLNNVGNTTYTSLSGNGWDDGKGFEDGIKKLEGSLQIQDKSENSNVVKYIKNQIDAAKNYNTDKCIRYSMAIAYMLHHILNTTQDTAIKKEANNLLTYIQQQLPELYKTYFPSAQVQSNKNGGILKAQLGQQITIHTQEPSQEPEVQQQQEQPEQPQQSQARYARLDSEQGVLAGVSAIASAASCLGGIKGAVAGMISAGADIAMFAMDENMSTTEKVTQGALSLAMGALCFIPGLGAFAKAGKFARMAKGTKSILNGSKKVLTSAVKGMDAASDATKSVKGGIVALDQAIGVASKPGFAQKACSVLGAEGFGGVGFDLVTNGAKALPESVRNLVAKGHVTKVGNSINNMLTAFSLINTVPAAANLWSDRFDENKSWGQLNAYDVQQVAFTLSGVANWFGRTRSAAKIGAIDSVIGQTPRTQNKNIQVQVGTSSKWNPAHMGSKTEAIDIPVTGKMTKQEVEAAVKDHIRNLPDSEENKALKEMLNGNLFIKYDKSQFDEFDDMYYFINNIEGNASKFQQEYLDLAKKEGLFTQDQFEALRRWENGMDDASKQAFLTEAQNGTFKTKDDILNYLINLRSPSTTSASAAASRPVSTPQPTPVSTLQATPKQPVQLSLSFNKHGGTLVQSNKKGGSLSYEERLQLAAFKSNLSKADKAYVQRLRNRNHELDASYKSFKDCLDRIDKDLDRSSKGIFTTRLLILKSLM